MAKIAHKTALLLTVFAFLLSGCAIKAYDGAYLQYSEISKISSTTHHGPSAGLAVGVLPIIVPFPPFIIPMLGSRSTHTTTVIEIDGYKKSGFLPFKVSSGKHLAKVKYQNQSKPQNKPIFLPIEFVSKGGSNYKIYAEQKEDKNYVWVLEYFLDKSEKLIAGEMPP